MHIHSEQLAHTAVILSDAKHALIAEKNAAASTAKQEHESLIRRGAPPAPGIFTWGEEREIMNARRTAYSERLRFLKSARDISTPAFTAWLEEEAHADLWEKVRSAEDAADDAKEAYDYWDNLPEQLHGAVAKVKSLIAALNQPTTDVLDRYREGAAAVESVLESLRQQAEAAQSIADGLKARATENPRGNHDMNSDQPLHAVDARVKEIDAELGVLMLEFWKDVHRLDDRIVPAHTLRLETFVFPGSGFRPVFYVLGNVAQTNNATTYACDENGKNTISESLYRYAFVTEDRRVPLKETQIRKDGKDGNIFRTLVANRDNMYEVCLIKHSGATPQRLAVMTMVMTMTPEQSQQVVAEAQEAQRALLTVASHLALRQDQPDIAHHDGEAGMTAARYA